MQPTETPTATEIKTEKTEPVMTGGISNGYHHGHAANAVHSIHGKFRHSGAKKHKHKKDPEDRPEDEEKWESPQPPATFAVVIGLSCGALVIMILIIIIMAMRKSRSSNPTKTVLVDPDNDGNSEQQHLANLQQNGYENPVYKLSQY